MNEQFTFSPFLSSLLRGLMLQGLALTACVPFAAAQENIGLRPSTATVTTTTVTTFSMSMEVYTADVVDECPQFPGGDRALLRYINNHRQYPEEALNERVQGRVLCGFVVLPDGRVVNPNVVRGVDSRLDAEAVRLVKNMPKWHAGRHEGRSVAVYYVMPIVFRLQ